MSTNKLCVFCGRESKNDNSYRQHHIRCKLNPNHIKCLPPLKNGVHYNTGFTPWNKGLTKHTDDRVKKFGRTYSDRVADGTVIPSFLGRTHSLEVRAKISEKLSINNKGGRCKWYDFIRNSGDIVKLQGTWELRFAKVLEILDPEWIKISVNSKNYSFKWIDDEGLNHAYTPDFYCPKSETFYEVKGYWWGNDKVKMQKVLEQNEIKLEIIFKKDLLHYESIYIK